MPKKELIKQIISLSGLPEELSSEVFEKFTSELFKKLKTNGKLEVSGLGVFDIQKENPAELIFTDETESFVIAIENIKQSKSGLTDDVFSLSYNKPNVTLHGGNAPTREERLINERVKSILDNSFPPEGYESKVFDKYSFADLPDSNEEINLEIPSDDSGLIISEPYNVKEEIIEEDNSNIDVNDVIVDFKKIPGSSFEKIRGLTSEFSSEEEPSKNLTWDFGDILNDEIEKIETTKIIADPIPEPLDVKDEEFVFESDNSMPDEIFKEELPNLEIPEGTEQSDLEKPLDWNFNELPEEDQPLEELPVEDSSHELDNVELPIEEEKPAMPQIPLKPKMPERQEPKHEEEQKEGSASEEEKSEDDKIKANKKKGRLILIGGLIAIIVVGVVMIKMLGILGGHKEEPRTIYIASDGLTGKPDESGPDVSPLDLTKGGKETPSDFLVPAGGDSVPVKTEEQTVTLPVEETPVEKKEEKKEEKKPEIKKETEKPVVKQNTGEVSEISGLTPAGNLLFKSGNKFYCQIYSFESVDKAKRMAVQVTKKTGMQLYIYIKSKTRISIVAGGFNSIDEAKAFQKPYL